jgi:pSer/pThr/pTyr-binding forkhead associated (FHA) protein
MVAPRPAAFPAPAPAYSAPPRPPAGGAGPQGQTVYTDTRGMFQQVVGVLVAVDGELEGEIFRVSDGENRLGRAEHCEIRLQSEKISREHAKIMHQGGVFAIAPLSDRNPTLVNGEPTEGSELRDGDTVKVGRTTLRFRSVV